MNSCGPVFEPLLENSMSGKIDLSPSKAAVRVASSSLLVIIVARGTPPAGELVISRNIF